MQNGVQTKVGKKSNKKKSGASANLKENNPLRVRKKITEKPPNPDCIKGILSDLPLPPVSSARDENKKQTNTLLIDFIRMAAQYTILPLKSIVSRENREKNTELSADSVSPWTIFKNDPDLYINYGDCVLNLWIYYFKFFSSEEQVDAIRILEDEVEKLSQTRISCLVGWDVPSDQAGIIVKSRRSAFLNYFSDELWGSKNPELDCSNEQEKMRARLYRSRRSHLNVSFEYETAFMQEQLEKDQKKVTQCLLRILSGKKSASSRLDIEANCNRTLIFNWILGEPVNGIPPMCMWSSQAIIKILKLEGHNLKGFMFDSVKNRVSKQINRLGLVRPTPPVPSYSVKYTNGMFSMHPTKRGDVNSGKQTSGP